MVDGERPITWIDADERVPHNRRKVLAWGNKMVFRVFHGGVFLGETRCNLTSEGAKWDCEKHDGWSHTVTTVTHWAEIAGPHGEASSW